MSERDWKNARKRRDRLHIMAEVLTVTRDGALKTQIMYRANLSFAQLNEYLSFLLELGLLKIMKKGEKKIYKTTRKGIRYLRSHSELRALLGDGEKHNVTGGSPRIYLAKSVW